MLSLVASCCRFYSQLKCCFISGVNCVDDSFWMRSSLFSLKQDTNSWLISVAFEISPWKLLFCPYVDIDCWSSCHCPPTYDHPPRNTHPPHLYPPTHPLSMTHPETTTHPSLTHQPSSIWHHSATYHSNLSHPPTTTNLVITHPPLLAQLIECDTKVDYFFIPTLYERLATT